MNLFRRMQQLVPALIGFFILAQFAGIVPRPTMAQPSAMMGMGSTPKASIELFTSQGCSSCPAADKLIGELGQDRSLVTMSLPVDLWDYIGWKDTLALKDHSTRQKA